MINSARFRPIALIASSPRLHTGVCAITGLRGRLALNLHLANISTSWSECSARCGAF
nr:MAG TPA: hypothetical protein [Caudoviricetes sp.]